jgi:argininosuccinate lyase
MSKKLWGGCFSKDIDSDVLDYTLTTDVDKRLVRFDIWGSMAHLVMLGQQQIVSDATVGKILPSLLNLYHKNKIGALHLDRSLEDVHLNIEALIINDVGAEFGGQLHTARSRNDQVVTDTRMYLREELLNIQRALVDFIESLMDLADSSINDLAVGYTHLQPAQPISLAFWYSAHASIFLRDLERLADAYNNTNRNVLGACALAGTSFPIDRELTRKLQGFDRLIEHSLDATSSRDFIIQSVSAFSIMMSNFSKLAEEIVIWNSFEFGLLKIDDAFATGSSIMPQKKNPVVAELAKGRSGRVYGALMQILTTTKGVTLGYNCDLQEDKPLLWDSIETVKSTTNILHRHVVTSTYKSDRAADLCWKNFSTVTELANMLVKNKEIAFREAHRITGLLTRELIDRGADLRDTLFVQHFLRGHAIDATEDEIVASTSPVNVMTKQTSTGSTGPDSVTAMLQNLKIELNIFSTQMQNNLEKVRAAEDFILKISNDVKAGARIRDLLLAAQ